jgi:hypothetical protein
MCESLWMDFCILYKEVLAAGCVVENQDWGIICGSNAIHVGTYPKAKWSLAKALKKRQHGRSRKKRVSARYHSLAGHLRTTYHTYEEGRYVPILKTTFWFHAHA